MISVCSLYESSPTDVIWAAYRDHTDVVKALLNSGASIEAEANATE